MAPSKNDVSVAVGSKWDKFMEERPRDFKKLSRFQNMASGMGQEITAELLGFLEDRRVEDGVDISKLLHGPTFGKQEDREYCMEICAAHGRRKREGNYMYDWNKWQEEAAAVDPHYASHPCSVNVCVPDVIINDKMPYIANTVILAHPEDCMRVAKVHVKKSPFFEAILFGSIISTTENDHWKAQRAHLSPVFLPQASLKEIFPITSKRAAVCAERLTGLNDAAGKYGVQVNDFYLHEAMAQLQLGLMGLDEDFMEGTNGKIRQIFNGSNPDMNYGRDVVLKMMEKVQENPAYSVACDDDVLNKGKKVFGPLSKSVADADTELGMDVVDQWGNMMIILFAGHDTTAHTMTWFTYEMSRYPEYQVRVQAEVDALFEKMAREGRELMAYEDCAELPFMTRCIMETLRLWGAVPNGTFRELQFAESVHGPGGEMVELPKGTIVQITSWSRHRSKALWGEDADIFNPDREFEDNECWGLHGEAVFSGTNPASKRFSPFTFAPRDCLGKNFAQMEMRAILANVFRRWDFTCSEPYKNPEIPIEMSIGTMGPRDLTPEGLEESAKLSEAGKTPVGGMYLHLKRRQTTKSKL
jgi:cytochrome P450